MEAHDCFLSNIDRNIITLGILYLPKVSLLDHLGLLKTTITKNKKTDISICYIF